MCGLSLLKLVAVGEPLGFPLDDSWIHMVFARNTAHGDFFAYNPHEPIAGSTSPLWVFLMVPAFWLKVDPVIWAYALGTLFLILTGITVYAWAKHFTDDRTALLAGLIIVSSGRMIWSALSGMEITLSSFLFVLTAYSAWKTKKEKASPLPAGVLASLNTYARPEGYLFAAMLFVYLLLKQDEKKPLYFRIGGFKSAIIFAITYAVLTAPYPIACYLNWGKPLPTTYYSKKGAAATVMFHRYWITVWSFFLKDNIAAALLALAGMVLVVKKPASGNGIPALAASWVALFLGVEGFMFPITWTYARYTIPLWPFLAVLAVYAFDELASVGRWSEMKLTVNFNNRDISMTIKTLMFWLILLLGARDGIRWSQIFLWDVRGINEINVKMGKYIAEHVPEGETVAVNDIGAIAYFGKRRVVDLMGIITPEVARFVNPSGVGLQIDLAYNAWEFLKCRPDIKYVACFPTWFPKIMKSEYFTPLYSTSYHGGDLFDRKWINVKVLYKLRRENMPPCEAHSGDSDRARANSRNAPVHHSFAYHSMSTSSAGLPWGE